MTEVYQYLARLKQKMIDLAHAPLRSEYQRLEQTWQREYDQLKNEHKQAKANRRIIRSQLKNDDIRIKELDKISQAEKQEKQRLKDKWQNILEPIMAEITKLDRELYALKEEYKIQSKLLQHHLIEEFRTGKTDQVEIIYHDRDFVVVAKPQGLLSVPGRYGHNQDSAYLRLKQQLQTESIFVVHRLDQATSGVLLFVLNQATLHYLTKEWHHTTKIYEALLPGGILTQQGTIDLPLAPDPEHPPRQKVTIDGKPSLTEFFVVCQTSDKTRMELHPKTGRTHQLRVHCRTFFGVPILGDRLYGCAQDSPRLYLHARELNFTHPRSGEPLQFHQPTPF